MYSFGQFGLRTKKIKQVGISKKCTLKKFSSNSKEENKLKKQDCLHISIRYQETKLFGVYCSHLYEFFIWNNHQTMFSYLIAYRKLKAILFFSIKFDKNCKIFNLFSSFEFEKNFLNVHFFEMPTCYILCNTLLNILGQKQTDLSII
jgi:hypothetical protein